MDFVDTQNALEALVLAIPALATVMCITDQKGNVISIVQQKLQIANPTAGKKGGEIITILQATGTLHDPGRAPDAELQQVVLRLHYVIAITEHWKMNRSTDGTNIPALRTAQLIAAGVHGQPNGNPAGRKLSRFLLDPEAIIFVPVPDDNIVNYQVHVHTYVTLIPQPQP